MGANNRHGWTDKRIERLKALHAEGLSGSEIALSLGGVTRNAVIGKIARLGLSGRVGRAKPQRAPRVGRPPKPAVISVQAKVFGAEKVRPITEERPRPVHQVDEAPGTATLLTLGVHMCKWPIGDPASETFTVCGRRAEENRPYCAHHVRVAYQPVKAGKPRTGNELARALRRYL